MNHRHGSILATVGLTLVIAVTIGMLTSIPISPTSRTLAPLSASAATSTVTNLISGGLTSSVASSSPLNTYTFSGYAVNIGPASAGASETRLRVDFLTGSSAAKMNPVWDLQLTASTSALAPGGAEFETWSYATTTQPNAQGTGLFEVCADVANQVFERSEADNCVLRWF